MVCFCFAATQLAHQLHQERLQVVCSNKEARRHLTESNGTLAMDLWHMNVVLTRWIRSFSHFCICIFFSMFCRHTGSAPIDWFWLLGWQIYKEQLVPELLPCEFTPRMGPLGPWFEGPRWKEKKLMVVKNILIGTENRKSKSVYYSRYAYKWCAIIRFDCQVNVCLFVCFFVYWLVLLLLLLKK